MATPELKRVLNLPAVAFIAIGFTIGGGVFVFAGIVFKISGQALPVAYALAVIPVFISMLPIAMLGSAPSRPPVPIINIPAAWYRPGWRLSASGFTGWHRLWGRYRCMPWDVPDIFRFTFPISPRP
jgi:hypothetical protein